jgi:hypothetical protein
MKTLMKWLATAAVVLPPCLDTAVGETRPEVKLMRVPEGGVQPQALVDEHGTLHLIYLRGETQSCDVMYCERRPDQTAFSTPLRVNSKPGSAIAVGTVRGAQLALGRNGRVHVAWNGSDAAITSPGVGVPMLYSRLNDNSEGFEPQRNLMTLTTHLDGGGSVAADADGRVYVVWHGHRKVGPQEELDRGVFVAYSADDGKTFTPERQVNPVDTGVCGCCGLKAFADSQGSVAILYRSANSSGGRDSVLLVSTNHGAAFTSRVLGQWHVGTCPMSTHALGQAGTSIEGMWEKEGQIYFASIEPAHLEAVSARAAGGATGNRKHPTFARGRTKGSTTLIAWTEGTGWEKGGSLAWECLDSNGITTTSGRVDGLPVWDFAAAAADPGESFTLIY